MDGFNEKSNEEVEQQQPLGCLHRFSKTIKIVIIGGLIILLMIPMFMIEDLISERGRTQEEAINEVNPNSVDKDFIKTMGIDVEDLEDLRQAVLHKAEVLIAELA